LRDYPAAIAINREWNDEMRKALSVIVEIEQGVCEGVAEWMIQWFV
jgi:hypothetical protein